MGPSVVDAFAAGLPGAPPVEASGLPGAGPTAAVAGCGGGGADVGFLSGRRRPGLRATSPGEPLAEL